MSKTITTKKIVLFNIAAYFVYFLLCLVPVFGGYWGGKDAWNLLAVLFWSNYLISVVILLFSMRYLKFNSLIVRIILGAVLGGVFWLISPLIILLAAHIGIQLGLMP